MLKPDSMEAQLLPGHCGTSSACSLALSGIFESSTFIKSVREQNQYDKLGAVGYCFGVGITVRLVPFKTLDSIVLCHPSALTEASIKAVDIPTARACAEQDMAFPHVMRLKAEAIFAARKDKADFVPYEFVDYKELSMVSRVAQTLPMMK
jgi:carboxymethylenebutenolidase